MLGKNKLLKLFKLKSIKKTQSNLLQSWHSNMYSLLNWRNICASRFDWRCLLSIMCEYCPVSKSQLSASTQILLTIQLSRNKTFVYCKIYLPRKIIFFYFFDLEINNSYLFIDKVFSISIYCQPLSSGGLGANDWLSFSNNFFNFMEIQKKIQIWLNFVKICNF